MTEKTSLKQSRNPFLTIGRYVRQVIDETRKTVTPTAREWLAWSIAAFVFVILLMILVTGMDFGLGKLTLMVFVTLAMLLWMGIALLTFLLMSVWTDNPQHRSTYRHWAVAYLAALIVFIAIFYSEGTLWPFSSSF